MEDVIKVQPADALIVVDVQKDFCPRGALAVENGNAVVPVLNALMPKFGCVVFTRDWHPADHCSFAGRPGLKTGAGLPIAWRIRPAPRFTTT